MRYYTHNYSFPWWKIIAFDRPKLSNVFSYIDATQVVNFGNFSNQRALIIGGSRGVGAICSKLLIAGGAKVLFTYNQGLMEANEICSEINSPNLNSIQYDINNVNNDITKSIKEFAPTHIYYFVTPFIFSANKGHFDIKLFQKFSNYYIDGLYRIVSSFERSEELKLYYPSSIAIDELLDNMIEYSCSKIAGELQDFLLVDKYKTNSGETLTDDTCIVYAAWPLTTDIASQTWKFPICGSLPIYAIL